MLTKETLLAAQTKILDRATVDPTFRALCLADPHAAIKAATGFTVPREVGIRFEDTGEPKLAVHVPPSAPAGELDDAQLEAVAGGYAAGPTGTDPVTHPFGYQKH